MKIWSFVKRNKLIVLVILAYAILFIVRTDKALEAAGNSIYYLLEMLQVLPIVFIMITAIEAWVPKKLILAALGDKSGLKGNLMALLLGSISAGPIYAAFPIGKSLLKKGAGVTNIVIILSAWAVIKVPMLANEAKFLGLEFMAVRWILTVVSILIMGYITAMIVKKKSIPGLTGEKEEKLTINEDTCIGCGVCSRMIPEVYELKEGKAYVVDEGIKNVEKEILLETIKECPAKAISMQ